MCPFMLRMRGILTLTQWCVSACELMGPNHLKTKQRLETEKEESTAWLIDLIAFDKMCDCPYVNM